MHLPISQLIQANKDRKFFFNFNENPKAYSEEEAAKGLLAFQTRLNTNYDLPANLNTVARCGEEVSPYLQTGLGIHYPLLDADTLVNNGLAAFKTWKQTSLDQRFEILYASLENVSKRFFEMAYATMHTTGQSFLMSFQASGPHACDSSL